MFRYALRASLHKRPSIQALGTMKMTIIESIILGVVSGVFTSALLWVSVALIKLHVIPWYRAQKYEGLDVSGTWVATPEPSESSSAELELTINQQAHELTGDATVLQTHHVTNQKIVITSLFQNHCTL